MKRFGAFLILPLLAACTMPAPPPVAENSNAVAHRVGEPLPDAAESVGRCGPQADRGIGGTGAPVAVKPPTQRVDRGIGGTGIASVVADRRRGSRGGALKGSTPPASESLLTGAVTTATTTVEGAAPAVANGPAQGASAPVIGTVGR